MPLYEDEKGPIAAKTHGGASGSPIKSRVSKAQKTKGVLNVFGIYNHTNNQMWTHGYRKKTGNSSWILSNEWTKKYDDSVKQTFLV